MENRPKIIVQVVVVVALLFVGVAGYKMLAASRDALGHQQPEIPLPLVRTVPVQTGPVDMSVTGLGTVRAAAESRLVPQISGQVVRVSADLVNGGRFKKGQELLVIDPRDYEIAVTLAEAGVKEAESRYETARQESEAARKEWRKFHSGEPVPPLVAREPQLLAARAGLEAQQANLEKARLNLERTRLTAPFNGRVSAEQVDVGQFVAPGQALADLYATDTAEIVVPLENDDLQWLDVPGFTCDQCQGSAARVRTRVAGHEMTWPGRVVRAEGAIDPRTRLVNVVVRVTDPYATQPPLPLGQFVKMEISGRTLPSATVIPRAALRGENTVWVVDPEESRLHLRPVDIARQDERGVVIRDGIEPGDLAVVSPLKAVTDGMKVRFLESRDKPIGPAAGEAS